MQMCEIVRGVKKVPIEVREEGAVYGVEGPVFITKSRKSEVGLLKTRS